MTIGVTEGLIEGFLDTVGTTVGVLLLGDDVGDEVTVGILLGHCVGFTDLKGADVGTFDFMNDGEGVGKKVGFLDLVG
jgi:hypothetical protein